MALKVPQKPQATSNFEKLLAEDKADKLSEDAALKRQRGHAKRNRRLMLSVLGGITALLIVTIAVYDPFTNSLRFGSGPGQTAVQAPGDTSFKAPQWWQEPGNVFPVKLDDWQQQTFTPKKADSLYKSIQTYYSGSSLESYALELPAESTGFTHDPKQELLANGSINPMFSYWTKELFVSETGSMLQRLINPTYGNWATDGYNGRLTQVSYNALKDLFSKTWLAQNPTSKNLPLFAPSDPTIQYLPEGGTRWVGQIDNLQMTFAYDMSIRNYRVSVVADISYTSWTSSKEKKVEKAKLNLSLVPNQGEYDNGSANHVVIDASQIEVTS